MQRAAGVIICPKPKTGASRDSWWVESSTVHFRCNEFDWEENELQCYNNYGFTGHNTWKNTYDKRGFNCLLCRDDQIYISGGTGLCRCAAGYQGELKWDATCSLCTEGKFSDTHSLTACKSCDSGQISSAGSTGCTNCAAGKHSVNNFCTVCADGKTSREKSSNCDDCIAGKYSNDGNICQLCPPGHSSPVASPYTGCVPCAAGKYSNSERVCTSCASGQVSAVGQSQCRDCESPTYASPAASACPNCEAGKYWSAKNTCTECGEGKYSQPGATVCLECVFSAGAFVSPNFNSLGKGATACRVCGVGTYTDRFTSLTPGALACKTCDSGYYLTSHGAPVTFDNIYFLGKVIGRRTIPPCNKCKTCTIGTTPVGVYFCSNTGTYEGTCNNCNAGNYYYIPDGGSVVNASCKQCEQGKYQTIQTMLLHQEKCEPCPTYTRATENLTHSTSAVGSTERGQCVCESTKGFLYPPGTTSPQCVCGTGKVYKDGKCENSPANTYQPDRDALNGKPCPTNSNSSAGSKKIDDCICLAGTTKPDPAATQFKCECVLGNYFNSEKKCVQCGPCAFREWRNGCGGNTHGICQKCVACDTGKKRVGCNWIHEGRCEDEKLLSPEPLCPDIASTTTRQQVGIMQDLGGFGFEEVFGVVSQNADFACGQICDGTTNDDGTQCGGPFACGVRTCVEKMSADISRSDSLFDVLVCPVTISPEDTTNVKLEKTNVGCVTCEKCGDSPTQVLSNNWGSGCVRECSQLRCATSEIWDWTMKKCVLCPDLRDQRLCATQERTELQLHSMLVTGYMPLLYFEGCSGQGDLGKITYGKCHKCADIHGKCTVQTQYPDSCRLQKSTGVGSLNIERGCGVCLRSLDGDVDVVQGSYKNSTGWVSELYCQITNCKDKNNGQRTGVRQNAICLDRCLVLVCGEHEILIPCRLPHQTRCDTVWPVGREVVLAFDGRQPNAMAGPEVNLFSEKRSAGMEEDEEPEAVGFASFENTLITLNTLSAEHYQCVWNAANIQDNRAFPGGISESRLMPMQASWRVRGDKACERWTPELESGDESLPVLPLQNTVSGKSGRRVMINTEAHVLSYEYNGGFAGVNIDVPDSQKVGPVEVDLEQLTGAHAGGRGKLYLMMTLRMNEARVEIDVPDDRNLITAGWPTSLLLTCAVSDVTTGGGAGRVRFSAHQLSGNETAMELHSQSQHMGMSITSELFELEHSPKKTSSKFVLSFTAASVTAFNSWNNGVQTVCAESTMKGFLEGEGACRVLNYNKSVPMQMEIKAAETCDSACQMRVPLVLFYTDNAFQSAKVEGAVIVVGEVLVGTPSENLLEQSQRRALRRMQNFTALRHFDIASVPFERNLNWTAETGAVPRQAHAVDAYSRCAVLLATDTSIFCAGSEGLETLWQNKTANDRAMGVAFAEVDANPVVLALLDLNNVVLGYWQLCVITHIGASTTQVDDALMVSSWVSFAVLVADVVALEIGEDRRMIVETYWLSFSAQRLKISTRTTGLWYVFGEKTFNVGDPWLRFSRVVTTPRSSNAVVAAVWNTQTELDTTVLCLMVCAVPWVPYSSANASSGFSSANASAGADAAQCANATVEVEDSVPGFISVAFLGVRPQENSGAASGAELWLVGVLGFVFELELGKDAALINKRTRSHLVDRSFVQVGAASQVQKTLGGGRADAHAAKDYGLVYYTMDVRNLMNGRLTAFLPGFLRVDAASLSVGLLKKGAPHFSGYQMLIAYTGTDDKDLNALRDLQISIGPARYRESKSAQAARAMESTKTNREADLGMKTTFKYDQTLSDAVGKWLVEEGGKKTLFELGMPEVVGGAKNCDGELNEKKLEAANDSLMTMSLAMLIVLPVEQPTSSIVFLVRLGFARNNTYNLRGLALARCYNNENKKITSGYNIDTIESVLYYVDAGSNENPANAVLSFNVDTQTWTIHKMDAAGEEIETMESKTCNCISLAPGSAIVMAQKYENDIRETTVKALLGEKSVSVDSVEDSAKERPSSSNVPAHWRRERLVVNSHEKLRVRLGFTRTASFESSDRDPSIGLDDIQLLPMLTESTFVVGVGEEKYLKAYVKMPLREDLRRVGLAHLERPGDTADDDAVGEGSWESAWARLHVTVALKVGSAARSGCRYQAQFYYEENVNLYLLPIGCELAASSAHVRGAWAQCMLELPLDRPNVPLLVNVSVAKSPSQSSSCDVEQYDLVLVFIDANTALYECPAGSFLAGGESLYAGVCAPCRGGAQARSEQEATRSLAPTLAEEARLCGEGSFLKGCPALLSKHTNHSQDCESCAEVEVQENRALYSDILLEDAEPCKWKCRDEFYETGHGTGRKCVRCGEPESCSAGLYWKNCSATGNSACTACPDLRGRTGADGEVRERYVLALETGAEEFDVDVYPFVEATYNSSQQAERRGLEAELQRANGTHVCRSRCSVDAFLSEDRMCKRCTPAQFVLEQQLEKSLAGGEYFAVVPCSPGNDTYAQPCLPRKGTKILGHDPAATGDCPRECISGWRVNFTFSNRDGVAYTSSCVQCENVKSIDAQYGTRLPSETEAGNKEDVFEFALNTCALACRPPYVLLRERLRWVNESNSTVPEDLLHFMNLEQNRTCVRCSADACGVGSYPTGLLCECAQCEMPDI